MFGFGSFIDLLINIPVWILEIFLSKEERIKRKIARTPLKPLSEVKVGDFVKIKGKAQRYDRISKAPLSREECLCYQTLVTRLDLKEPRELAKEEVLHWFYVVEGNHQMLIVPSKAEVDLKRVFMKDSGLLNDPTEEVRQFISRYEQKGKFLGVNKGLEASEKILKEGQDVEVVGKVSVFRTRNSGTHIVLRTLEDFPLYIKA